MRGDYDGQALSRSSLRFEGRADLPDLLPRHRI